MKLNNVAKLIASKKVRQPGVYLRILAACASGTEAELKDEDVAEVLHLEGKSIADLEADIDSAKQRRQMLTDLAEVETMQGELPGIEAGIAAAKAELQVAQQKCADICDPMDQRRTRIHQATKAIEGHFEKLVATCRESALLDEYQAAQSRAQIDQGPGANAALEDVRRRMAASLI